MQSQLLLCLAASLSLALSLPSPASLLFLSLYSTDTAPPPASLISRIRYSFKKHTLLGVVPRLRSHRGKGEGGSHRLGELEIQKGYVCRDHNQGLKACTMCKCHSSFGVCDVVVVFSFSFAVSMQRQISVICHVSRPKISLHAAAERLSKPASPILQPGVLPPETRLLILAGRLADWLQTRYLLSCSQSEENIRSTDTSGRKTCTTTNNASFP